MTNSIRWILFDLGGVIVDLDFPGFVERTCKISGASEKSIQEFLVEAKSSGRNESSPTGQYALGQLTTREFFEQFQEILPRKVPTPELTEIFCSIIKGPNQTSEKMLGMLSKVVELACYSNTNQIHWEKMLAIVPAMEHFSHKYASQNLRAVKPEPTGYQTILKELGVESDEVLFVDDNVANAEAAQALGMHSVHFQSHKQLLSEMLALPISEETDRACSEFLGSL